MSVESSEKSAPAIHSELEVMRVVGEAIENLDDPEARARVLSWLGSRFSMPHLGLRRKELEHPTDFGKPAAVVTLGEMPGIARLTASGELEVIVRDLKARSTVDAAIRLAHVVIYANEKLKGERTVSSRAVLSPILKEWRAYDGNTRPALARHRGIHRDGDALSLDTIAKKEAEKYIDEILDDTIQGTWNPNRRPTKKRAVKKDEAVEE